VEYLKRTHLFHSHSHIANIQRKPADRPCESHWHLGADVEHILPRRVTRIHKGLVVEDHNEWNSSTCTHNKHEHIVRGKSPGHRLKANRFDSCVYQQLHRCDLNYRLKVDWFILRFSSPFSASIFRVRGNQSSAHRSTTCLFNHDLH
jgi:hypothetical protein